MLRQATRWSVSVVSRLVVLAPVLALLPAALLDIGPDGTVRASVFPLVLTAYDSLMRTSMINSLAVSAGVAAGSVAVGVSLGRILCRWRFWGRPFFAAVVSALAVVPPGFLALGLLGLSGGSGPGPWTWLWARFSAPEGAAHSWPWLLWTWAALIQGVALVVVSARAALDRLDPDLEDAARLAGAAPWRIWWTLLWPILRPTLMATGGLIFLFNLADPGPPLVLGLRRTLAFQIVTSALRSDPFPRIAAAGLIVLLFALAGGALALWPGGAKTAAESEHDPVAGRSPRSDERRVQPSRDAARARALAWSLLLVVWSLLAWLPVAGLFRLCLQAASPGVSVTEKAHPVGASVRHSLFSDPAGRLLFHSVLLGASVFVIVALLARWPARLPPGPRFRSRERTRSGRDVLIWSVPPLVVGVGMLAFLRVAELAGRLLVVSLGWRGTGASVARLALESSAGADAGTFPCCGRLPGDSAAATDAPARSQGLGRGLCPAVRPGGSRRGRVQTRDEPGPTRRLGDTGAEGCPLGDARRDQHRSGGALGAFVCELARWTGRRRAGRPAGERPCPSVSAGPVGHRCAALGPGLGCGPGSHPGRARPSGPGLTASAPGPCSLGRDSTHEHLTV